MGSRMIRDRSSRGGWWLMVGLFTFCVVGWSLAFSFKVGAADRAEAALGGTPDRTWSVADFDRISIAGSLDVVLLQGAEEAVLARGNESDLDLLDVYVKGSELVIKPKRRSWWRWDNMDDVQLLVRLRDIERLAVSGSGEVDVEQLAVDDLRVSLSGSSDIRITQLDATNFDLRISGSADVEVAGSVTEQSVSISGSGDYDGFDLASVVAELRISGSGDARVHADNSLEVAVSGSGSVRYSGAPEVSSRVSGSGSVVAVQ